MRNNQQPMNLMPVALDFKQSKSQPMSKILTKQEFFDKYGKVKVLFSAYHKRSFYFNRMMENKAINIAVAASCDNILEFGVSADRLYPIIDFYDKIENAYIREFGVIVEEFREDFNVSGTF
jgi:hypothetical protein